MAASALVLFVNGKRQQIGPVVSSLINRRTGPEPDRQPTLIPSDAQIDEVDISRPPCWVLVIEKEVPPRILAARFRNSWHCLCL